MNAHSKVDPQSLANAMSTVLLDIRKGKFFQRLADTELFAWVRLHLADRGIYAQPMGNDPLYLITHTEYIKTSRRVLDESIVAEARRQMNQKVTT